MQKCLICKRFTCACDSAQGTLCAGRWVWVGVGFDIGAIFFFNAIIVLCNRYLPRECTFRAQMLIQAACLPRCLCSNLPYETLLLCPLCLLLWALALALHHPQP